MTEHPLSGQSELEVKEYDKLATVLVEVRKRKDKEEEKRVVRKIEALLKAVYDKSTLAKELEDQLKSQLAKVPNYLPQGAEAPHYLSHRDR